MIGERVNTLMVSLGLSQAELARRVGISQPAIYQLIYKNKSGSRHLPQIARELGTTAAYLNGDTDDPDCEFPDQHLTGEEIGWVQKLGALDPADRKTVLALVDSLIGKGASSRALHDRALDYRAG